MSSCVTTAAAAGAWSSLVDFLKSDVSEMTSTSTRSSMLMSARRAEVAFGRPPFAVAASEKHAPKKSVIPIPQRIGIQHPRIFRNELPNAAPVSFLLIILADHLPDNAGIARLKAMNGPFLIRF